MTELVNLVRIGTNAGTSYYNPQDRVLVKLGMSGDGVSVYTDPKARDLKKVQQVAWDKDRINVSLEQIASSLATQPDYASAQAAVFATNPDGTFWANKEGKLVPLLKYHLISGLRQLARSSTPNLQFLAAISDNQLERKIQGKDEDFSPDEYMTMARAVHSYVVRHHEQDNAPLVQLDAVRDWIKGDTVGPQERNMFYSLFDVNPVFEKWLQTLPGQDSPWDSYKVWVIVRQGLRQRFETVKAKGGQTAGYKDASMPSVQITEGVGLSLSPFMQHVLNSIFEPVSRQHVNVMVTGVAPVTIEAESLESLEKALEEKEAGQPKPHL